MEELNALLREAQAGDLNATGELFERFRGMATGYAWSLLGDVHLAEDAAQAAYLEACLHLSRVYSAEAFPAWLRRLVFKQCDRIRRKSPPQTVILDEAALPPVDTPDASTALEAHERIQNVRAVLAALPQLERQVSLLRYYQMRSRGEIADILELTPGQVAYRLRSARRLFKTRMVEMSQNKPSVSETIRVGQDALRRIGDDSAPPELARSIGLLREHVSLGNVRSDGEGQNLLQHSLEVAQLAALVAERLGLDPIKARRAGLLHEIGKILDDGSVHYERGAQKAAELGEDPDVVEAIANHHERGERLSPECFRLGISPLCFALCAADTFSADRFQGKPGAEPGQLVDQLVELAGGDAHAHVYLFGLELRVLAKGGDEDPSEAAQKVAERARNELGFEGKVRVAFAPG